MRKCHGLKASHSITQSDSAHRNAQHSSSRRTCACLKKAYMTCVHSSLPRHRIKVPRTPATGVRGPGWSHRLVPPRIAGVVRDSLALHCWIHGCGSLCLLQWQRQSQTPVKRAQCSTQHGRHVKHVHVRSKKDSCAASRTVQVGTMQMGTVSRTVMSTLRCSALSCY